MDVTLHLTANALPGAWLCMQQLLPAGKFDPGKEEEEESLTPVFCVRPGLRVTRPVPAVMHQNLLFESLVCPGHLRPKPALPVTPLS